ncbi:MAG TPA: glycosyltransferase family 9 protein [Candidatus Limnocylindria bacterium]|nr:glycosyltransferase family 9 protein [Candidatus Limnocylindria bacterium]
MRRALAVHPGALGDVLLAIPALRALRARHGTVMLVAQPRIADLLVALGLVDEACAVDRLGLDALFVDDGARARLCGADRVVCWLGARDAAFVRRLSAQAPSVTVAPSVGDGLVWEHLLRTAAPGAPAVIDPVVVPAALREAGRDLLRGAGWDGASPLLLVHPGAGGVGKRWPADGFASVVAEVVAERAVTVVVHQGPADAEPVAALVRPPARLLVLEEPSLPGLAGALAQASAYIGNDSGVSHLAGTVGTPAVVLFVAANLRWRSWSASVRAVTVEAARVRPEDAAAVVDVLAGILGRGAVAPGARRRWS